MCMIAKIRSSNSKAAGKQARRRYYDEVKEVPSSEVGFNGKKLEIVLVKIVVHYICRSYLYSPRLSGDQAL